jgi:hypothetical protein
MDHADVNALSNNSFDRRTFVKAATSTIAAQQIFAAALGADTPENNCMIYRKLGRTGERVSGIDSPRILDQAFEATHTFKLLSEARVAAILDRTRVAAEDGKYELYKTTARFDGTAHRPQMLG